MNRPPVSVIGLGAMGTALASSLLAGGHPTTVWNRSAGRTDALAARGATVAATAAGAAAASPLVLLCVTDYRACGEVLDSVADALSGRVLVNLTTGTPDEARALATRAGRWSGAGYLDGVVQAGPDQIGTPAATMFYAGDRATYHAHEATFDLLGSASFAGEDPGQACLYDLALLGLWYEAEVAVLNALALVGAPDADTEAFLPYARRQLGYVVDALPEVAAEVRERRYPRGPASLADHARVLDQLERVRKAGGMSTDQVAYVHRAVRRLIDQGREGDGFTRVIEELTGRAPART